MTVYVCSERDIECGDNRSTWCESCPKRKTNDVKVPPLPEPFRTEHGGREVAWFNGNQMRAFYLQGYNDGLSAPRVLGAGLDPWPNSGDPVIADALRAPDEAIPLSDERIINISAETALCKTAEDWSLHSKNIRFASAIEAAHGIGEMSK